MKLIVGLGNPGKKYETTRHNLGFMVVDQLGNEHQAVWQKFSPQSTLSKLTIQGQPVILLKPQTFMNESGISVREVGNFYKISLEDTWVIHDDLDLESFRIKLDDNSSAAGHRGVQSIIDQLGSAAFKRWRLGVGRPPTNQPAEDFVLEPLPDYGQDTFAMFLEGCSQQIERALEQSFEKIQAEQNAKRRLTT